MEVSSGAFYAWAKKPEDTDKTRQRAALEAKARQLFDDHKQTYGYRRLSNELGKAGMKSGHYQVRHLMARLGLKARYPKRFKVTTDSNHNDAVSPNSLGRQFDVVAPTKFGQWILLTFGRLKVGCIWRLSLICSRGRLLASRYLATCGLRCASVRCKWPLGIGNQGLGCSTIRIGAANMPAMNTVGICLS
jgi:transposase InsO family protein